MWQNGLLPIPCNYMPCGYYRPQRGTVQKVNLSFRDGLKELINEANIDGPKFKGYV